MKVETSGVYDPVRKFFRPPGKYVLKGTPDIIGTIKGGRMILIEVKTPYSIKMVRRHYQNIMDKKPMPEYVGKSIIAQVGVIEDFKAMGAVGFFCSSVDEFLELLVKEGAIGEDDIPRLF
jgi:hypothetical protein